MEVNKRRFMDRFLPGEPCLLCTEVTNASFLCERCRSDLPLNRPACRFCARSLPATGLCPSCSRRPPPFRATAVFRYEYPLSLLIQRLKFRGHPGLGQALGQLMLETGCINIHGDRSPCLLPMPLHWRRQSWRGFNQALELARPIAAHLELSINTAACRRIRPSQPQSELGQVGRRDNVRGVFAADTDKLPHYVVIIDDVITSGHSVSALAHCLRRAGVQQIDVWALARAGQHK